MRSSILGAMDALVLLLFYNAFVYWNSSLVVDKVYPKRIFSC